MAAPEVSEAAEALYAALEPAFTAGDEDREYVVLRLCQAICAAELETIRNLVADQADGTPGWVVLLDPQKCPAAFLPWLAQLDGAKLLPNMSVEQERATIVEPEAFGRGTIAQIEAVAKRGLTGTKTVVIEERYTGQPWRIRVTTLEAETPDPARLKAEIEAQAKPIGLLLFFNEGAPWTYEEILAESEKYPTYEALDEAFSSYLELRLHEP